MTVHGKGDFWAKFAQILASKHCNVERMRGTKLARMLIVVTLMFVGACQAKRKKRRNSGPPVLPNELQAGCPFHKSLDGTDARELSEFGHELERDGRKAEAMPCYAAAIRTSPAMAIGWLDLAVAQQYDNPPTAIRYYERGLVS